MHSHVVTLRLWQERPVGGTEPMLLLHTRRTLLLAVICGGSPCPVCSLTCFLCTARCCLDSKARSSCIVGIALSSRPHSHQLFIVNRYFGLAQLKQRAETQTLVRLMMLCIYLREQFIFHLLQSAWYVTKPNLILRLNCFQETTHTLQGYA